MLKFLVAGYLSLFAVSAFAGGFCGIESGAYAKNPTSKNSDMQFFWRSETELVLSLYNEQPVVVSLGTDAVVEQSKAEDGTVSSETKVNIQCDNDILTIRGWTADSDGSPFRNLTQLRVAGGPMNTLVVEYYSYERSGRLQEIEKSLLNRIAGEEGLWNR